MKYYFDASDLENKENIAWLEDLIFECDYIEGSGLEYMAYGKASIEDETYADFHISFLLKEPPELLSCACIFNSEWVEYDYVFPV